MVCREMSAWDDILLIPDFACVTVPELIEYPQANYTSFASVFGKMPAMKHLGITGLDAMSYSVYMAVGSNSCDAHIIDANDILFELRSTKSTDEAACLKEAARIADKGYEALMGQLRPGISESKLEAAAIAAAKRSGAENIPFCLVSSGNRLNTIIGRATGKIVENGDMVMAALAVQYEGYIATVNFPLVAGTASEDQKKLIDILVKGEQTARARLKAGSSQRELVKAVKDLFRENDVAKYDLYPPLHGCGLAEAESPYPNECTESDFKAGMTVNIDLSLFGHPAGSNRIEEGFIVTENGYEPMSKLVSRLCDDWRSERKV
jgi:Xaa-Pro aminopeptidase